MGLDDFYEKVQQSIQVGSGGLISESAADDLTAGGITSAMGTLGPGGQKFTAEEFADMGKSGDTYFADPKDWFGTREDEENKERGFAAQSALQLDADWLTYLKGMYEPYSDVGTRALGEQAGMAGLRGDEMQQQMIADMESDPLYQANVAAGEEGVLRNQSATGGLRSGNAIDALAKGNQQLLGSEFDQKYNRYAGLSGQGFQGSNALGQYGGNTIGSMTNTMGSIESGNIAANAAKQARMDDMIGTVGSVVGGIFSDERLKTNIRKQGTKNGMPWYKWTWNETAEKEYGLSGDEEGHMATDVELNFPQAVGERDGYRTVDYAGLN